MPKQSYDELKRQVRALTRENGKLRKQVETAHDYEARLKLVSEHINDAVWFRNCETGSKRKILYVNRSFKKLFSIPAEKLLEMDKAWLKLLHKDDRKNVVFSLENFFQGKKTYDIEYRIIRPDNEIRWVWVRAFLLKDANGNPYRAVGIARDITEKKNTEESLKESEELWRSFAEQSPDHILLLDPHLNIVYANHASPGLTVEQLIGTPLYAYVIEELQPSIKRTLNKVFRTGITACYETQYRKPDGNIIHYDSMAVPRIYNKKIAGLIVVARDITKQKKAAAELKEQKDKAQNYLDIARMIIIAINSDGNVTLINKFGCNILQCKKEEIIGKNWFDNFIPERIRNEIKSVSKGILRGEIERFREYENPILARDGQERLISWHAIELRDDDGRITGHLGTGRDITEQRAAENVILESEQKYRTLFESMNQGVVYQDADGKITSANSSAERILGLTLDQMQGRTSFDPRWKSIHEDGSEFPGETHPSSIAIKTGKPVRDVIMGVFHPIDAHYRWIRIDAVPQFRPGEKKPYQIYSTFEDITEKKNSSEELERIFNMSAYMVCIADINGYFRKISPAFNETLGYTSNELLSIPFMEFVHPDDKQKTLDIIQEKLEKGEKVILFENRFRCKNGTYKWLAWTSKPVIEEGVTYAIAHDITSRKEAEESLRRSEEELKTIVFSMRDMLFQFDAEGRFVFYHIPTQDSYVKDASFLMKRHSEVMPAHVNNYFEEVFKKNREGDEGEFEYWLEINGKISWYSARLSPIIRDGKFTGSIAVVRNITQRKEMEHIVIRSEKMASIGLLAAGIGHEINNPLAYIINNLALLSKYCGNIKNGFDSIPGAFIQAPKVTEIIQKLSEVGELVNDSLEGTERIKQIVSDLRGFSREEPTYMEPADINQVIERTLKFVRSEIKFKAKLIKKLGDIPAVQCDSRKISQVIMNLLINAVQAIEGGGTIIIKTFQSADSVVIQISDTGAGIPAAELNSIFDTFYTTKEQGTGIGLSISYDIIKEHKGTLSLESAVGIGTTFTIKLPIMKEPVARETKILIIEDDEEVSIILEKTIKKIIPSTSVRTVNSGLDAGALLKSFRPDLIFLDIKLPGMDGFEVCRQIISEGGCGKAKIILMTGFDSEGYKKKAFEAGASDYLLKPFKSDKLTAILKKYAGNNK